MWVCQAQYKDDGLWVITWNGPVSNPGEGSGALDSSEWSRLTNWLPRVSCHTRCDMFRAVFKKYSRLIKKSESFFWSRWEEVTFNLHKHKPTHSGTHTSLRCVFWIEQWFFYPWTLFFKGLIKPDGSTLQILSGSATTHKGNKCLKLFVAPEGAAQSLMNCPRSFHLRRSWLGL